MSSNTRIAQTITNLTKKIKNKKCTDSTILPARMQMCNKSQSKIVEYSSSVHKNRKTHDKSLAERNYLAEYSQSCLGLGVDGSHQQSALCLYTPVWIQLCFFAS